MNIDFTENQIDTIWEVLWTSADADAYEKIRAARIKIIHATRGKPDTVTVDITEADRRVILAELESRIVVLPERAELIALFTSLALPLAVEEAEETPTGAS